MFKMHVNTSSTPSLTLNSSTLTTNRITGGSISFTGSLVKASTPIVAGVLFGLDSAAAGGI